MNQTIELLLNRQSLRSFADAPVSAKDRETILQAAMRAPTAGNLMCYTILEITDRKKVERLVETCDSQPMITKAPMVLIFLADMQRLFDYFRECRVNELCEREALPQVTPLEGDFLLAANDAVIAAQNAVLAAEALGMGSCYIGDIIENIEIHRAMFDLPAWTFPVTMLIIGHPKNKPTLPAAPRFPQEFIIHKNGYRRFSGSEFEEMFAEMRGRYFPENNYYKSAKNMGQHFYEKKIASGFMEELRRSFKKGLEEWCNAGPK
jgi:FMN reductase (NADPH)